MFSVIVVGDTVGLPGRNASSGSRASPWPVPVCYGLAKCEQFISGPSGAAFPWAASLQHYKPVTALSGQQS